MTFDGLKHEISDMDNKKLKELQYAGYEYRNRRGEGQKHINNFKIVMFLLEAEKHCWTRENNERILPFINMNSDML